MSGFGLHTSEVSMLPPVEDSYLYFFFSLDESHIFLDPKLVKLKLVRDDVFK